MLPQENIFIDTIQCDIVGTGGDSHNTFNISTTSSILASSLLMIGKHGNRSSTSLSGSADLLSCAPPKPPQLSAVNPTTLREVYESTNYAFLYAPIFHPGAKYAASIRKQLGWRTIFNLLGPLSISASRFQHFSRGTGRVKLPKVGV